MVTYRSVLETVTNRNTFKWLLTVRVVTKKPNMFEKNLMLNLDSVILEVKCPMGPLYRDDLFPSFDIILQRLLSYPYNGTALINLY